MTRGYACIGLDNPKDPANIGAVLRASQIYDTRMVAIAGPRYRKLKSIKTDTMAAWRHLPAIEVDDVFDVIPYACVPVAVDLIDGARPLPGYTHPQSAFYIFGAEDQTLGKRITDRCRDVIYIPGAHCSNLAAAVNVVLYDRMAKRMREDKREERLMRPASRIAAE